VPHIGTLVQKTNASHANDDADMNVDADDDDDDAAGSSAKAEGTGCDIHVQPTSNHAAMNRFTCCRYELIQMLQKASGVCRIFIYPMLSCSCYSQ